MAGAAVLPISSLSSFRLYSITSSSLSPFSHFLAPPLRNPRFTICHVKFDGSIGEAAERMYRMNFEDGELLEEDDDEESDEEEETESSIDLLVRFVQSMFKKVSKRARKATRSILPDVISPQLSCLVLVVGGRWYVFRGISQGARKLARTPQSSKRGTIFLGLGGMQVTFAVDGVLILALLSILKAFLEVVCSLGGAVFVAILLLRLLWSAVSYFQSTGSDFNSGGSSYGRTQPAA